ncbi:MAG TPA: hypothetical protein VGI78_27625 [Acetobacteraceae bacterium]
MSRPTNPRFAPPTVALFLFLAALEVGFAGSGTAHLLQGRWTEGVVLLAIGAAGLLGALVAASR